MATVSNIARSVDTDPAYQAVRLRGLAGLIRATHDGLADITNLADVCLFLGSALDEIADKLDGKA